MSWDYNGCYEKAVDVTLLRCFGYTMVIYNMDNTLIYFTSNMATARSSGKIQIITTHEQVVCAMDTQFWEMKTFMVEYITPSYICEI